MDKQSDVKRDNPWKRGAASNPDFCDPNVMHYITNLVAKRPKFSMRDGNSHLDIQTKRAALKASPYVVSLISYTGEEELYQSSGTIIERDAKNRVIVLTSAKLIRRPTQEEVVENNLVDNLKVVVKLSNDESYEGEICAHDFHYNIVAIRFQSNSLLPTATLRHVDDSIDLNPNQLTIPGETSFQLRPHSSTFSLVPGDAVIVIGRYFAEPFDLMAAPGEFSLDRCEYDCKELFMSTCRITRCGDGGPLINLAGEVIGISFYDLTETPFMPINIAYKWWEHYRQYGELRRPYLGMEAINFYATKLDVAEKIIQQFPTISKGVIVEKVISGSSSESAGLRLNDVIIQFGGKEVRSFLELCEISWDNVGQLVDLVVARAGHTPSLHLKMVVGEAAEDNLNGWPRRD